MLLMAQQFLQHILDVHLDGVAFRILEDRDECRGMEVQDPAAAQYGVQFDGRFRPSELGSERPHRLTYYVGVR
jgi:hypothetical protein